MHMIGHQDIGMHLACGFVCVLTGQGQIDEIIGLACEAGASIVAALDDVQWYRGQYQSWTSRHEVNSREKA
jgi:hypothetical protein